jgi:hypothetical protein
MGGGAFRKITIRGHGKKKKVKKKKTPPRCRIRVNRCKNYKQNEGIELLLSTGGVGRLEVVMIYMILYSISLLSERRGAVVTYGVGAGDSLNLRPPPPLIFLCYTGAHSHQLGRGRGPTSPQNPCTYAFPNTTKMEK